MKLISIIIPVFNESAGIESFYSCIREILSLFEYEFELIFVNDGSSDDTLQKLKNIKKTDNKVIIIDLSRNFGKEAALTAGIQFCKGDAAIPMDADMQDPPELISKLIAEWEKGYQMVLAKRIDRSSDTLAKRTTASIFYKIHNKISDVKIPENVGDFRLIDRDVINAINGISENQRFMKGIFAWVGFESSVVTYERSPRSAGKSSFNFWKLWNLAIQGVTSFSTIPLRVWFYAGMIVAFSSFAYGIGLIFYTLLTGIKVPGYASLITVILFSSGIQLIGIGILGEYIGRIYMESKKRPSYIIKDII